MTRVLTIYLWLTLCRKPEKWRNLLALDYSDYLEKDEFLSQIERKEFGKKIEAVFHQGACTDTCLRHGRIFHRGTTIDIS